MNILTKINYQYILKALNNAIKNISDTEENKRHINMLNSCVSIINAMSDDGIDYPKTINGTSINDDYYEKCKDIIGKLQQLHERYAEVIDLHVVSIYDQIKKDWGALLDPLSTYKSELENAIDLAEEQRKRVYSIVLEKIVDEDSSDKKMSIASAEKLIYKDERYKLAKNIEIFISAVYSVVDIKYKLYEKILHSIVQSCAQARDSATRNNTSE